jgi:hypothetical protein
VDPSISPARFATMSEAEIRSAERVLMLGTWAITAGALLFSVLTVTPLVQSVSPPGWEWTAPILPLVVDAAVIIVVRLDSVISRLGATGGPWPGVLRWMTGLMTLALNVGNSALHQDWVGMAVHAVAPLLLIVTAEAGLAYRRAITAALARIAREQAEAADRARAEREAKERAERADREKAEREAREHERQLEQERAEREEARLREEREHELALERERTEREAAERRDAAERAEREQRLRLEQERAAREHALKVAEREAAERREQAEREERVRRARAAQEEREKAARAPAGTSAAQAPVRRAVTAQVSKTPKNIEPVVMSDEFAGMTQSDAERALFELYRQARDATTYEEWTDDPQFKPGGKFCGSNLGRLLGRSDAAGRTNVKPKFEDWYDNYLKEKEGTRELVGVG